MTNPIDFDVFTKNYNDLLKEQTQFFSSNDIYFAKYKIDIVRKNIASPINRILEYGCGIGRNIPFLRAAFPSATIVGSDISTASLEEAKLQNPDIEFFQEGANVNSIEPFDLIFVAGVYHHIPPKDRASASTNLFNRLSPKGRVVIFEHNLFNPITRRIVSNCPYDEDAVLLSPRELKRYLIQANFEVERQSYCLFIPPKFHRLMAVERYLGWLPLGGQYWVQAKRVK